MSAAPQVSAAAEAAATAPAPRPAQPPTPRDLNRDAEALTEALLKKLGVGYTVRRDKQRNIVYISALDAKTFGFATKLLTAHADAHRRLLFTQRLRWNIAVVLPTLADYRRLSPMPKAQGFYHDGSRSLLSISLSSVLLHEFTHALHHNDQAIAGQKHGVWIREGLATLFQSARIEKGTLQVKVDVSVTGLQEALRKNKTVPISKLLGLEQKAFMRNSDVCYLQVRYLMLYLHSQGKLKDFYRAYKAGYDADRTGATTLETVLGKRIGQIEDDWRAWVLDLKAPWRPRQKSTPHLGVRMLRTPEGVRVTGLLPHSAAHRAGIIKIGDIIIAIAGQPTPTPRALAAAVQSCRPGQTVNVEILRDDRPVVLQQMLGATR